jgi:23S rRNA (uridine2552-2'-O)-methyltransferase
MAYDRKDHLYEKAKSEGYASRAAYKLKEIQQKFKLIKQGSRVLDLGCWPGGWLQTASELTGTSGVVVGLDLVAVEISLPSHVFTFQGDIRDSDVLTNAIAQLGGEADAVVSDMSPKLSGIPEVDRAASKGLNQMAFYAATKTLRAGGFFVAKVFKSNEAETFIKEIRPHFESIKRTELDSTRATSNEFYVVGIGYKKALSSA